MTPVPQAVGTVQAGTAAVSPAWPAHQADDIALLIAESNFTSPDTLSAPAGFGQIADSPSYADGGSVTTRTRLTVWWCRATSSSMAAPTVALGVNHIIAQIITFRDCITTGDPWDVTAQSAQTTADTSVEVPGDTTTLADCLIVAIASAVTDTATDQFSGWANTDLANVAEMTDEFTSLGNGGGFGVATGEKATAGAYGTTTATLATSSQQGRIAIALKPALVAQTALVVRRRPLSALLVR